MRKLCPHEDIDTLADALAVAFGHLINTGALEVSDEAYAMIAERSAQYDEDEYASLIETATRVMARARVAH
jgi:hypothetical protein